MCYKKLIWIDDNKDKVAQLVNSVFWLLWRKNIVSYVLFLGNDYKEYEEADNYREEDIISFIADMASSYGYFCNEQVQKHADLHETAMSYFSRTVNQYVNDSFVHQLDYESGSSEKIIDLIKNYIPDLDNEKYAFAIDLRLFLRDYENTMKNDIIESMEIVNELKKKGFSYYLYSSFRYDVPFISNWKKTAEEKYRIYDEIWSSMELQNRDDENKNFKELLNICEIKKEGKNEAVNN